MGKLGGLGVIVALLCGLGWPAPTLADSVNSPNVTLNVDTNRSVGAGAGNVAVVINTITLAEIAAGEYSSGAGKAIVFQVRPGYVFDPTSNVTAQSATIGFNGAALNAAAAITPTGTLDEALTFELTSGADPTAQDIIRVNGITLKIGSAAGAVGPAQTTMQISTSAAGGAFTGQGIVAANITTGAPDQLVFSAQPSNVEAGNALLPAVRVADFGGNLIANDTRIIILNLQENPGAATLNGINGIQAEGGRSEWTDGDDLRINVAATGYTLRASHTGNPLQSSDTADSQPFDVTAGPPGRLVISTQPADTVAAGADILLAVSAFDDLDNPVSGIDVSLDLTTNPTDTQLLATTLTKQTVDGVATWDADENLRITTVGEGFRITASGNGLPVESDAFEIVPAAPNSLRYLQEPVDPIEGTTVEPPVRAEVIDEFGNRTTAFDDEVQLSLVESPCDGGLSGGTADAVDGVATFPNLVFDTSCAEGNVLKAAVPGLGWAGSEPFGIGVAADARAIPASLFQFKPGKMLKLVANGAFTLPSPATDDPSKDGGSLTVTGTTGAFTQALPAAGWTKLGPNKDGSKGFRFAGAGCPLVVVRANVIKAICKPNTGTLKLPEEGPVQVVLRVGGGTARYCAACGGTPKGNPSLVFKRKTCAPVACE